MCLTSFNLINFLCIYFLFFILYFLNCFYLAKNKKKMKASHADVQHTHTHTCTHTSQHYSHLGYSHLYSFIIHINFYDSVCMKMNVLLPVFLFLSPDPVNGNNIFTFVSLTVLILDTAHYGKSCAQNFQMCLKFYFGSMPLVFARSFVSQIKMFH